ncbi:hypothetical protein ACSBOB_18300 [Mesorhizobium sp. ASY16-5R]|uniref:hypothetical protein n=1 Tax=Mesorhizobium sp. ASY16-5R TaxID=3445772 RepID=UPI003F9FE891
MDGSVAIEKNWEALKRILASLVALVGMAEGAPTLPRQLYLVILRLLRPAESATRRLIIAAARGIVVNLPPLRPRKPKPAIKRGPRAFMPTGPKKRRRPASCILSLPLLDPLRTPSFWTGRARRTAPASLPRILSLDFDAPFHPLPAPPSSDKPVDAARLGRRLEALGRALDDLPGQAKRFARWKARNDAARARDREGGGGKGRPRRVSPLRRGRPPGGRLSSYDPSANHPRRIREIDEILAHAHALAVYALESPDTS